MPFDGASSTNSPLFNPISRSTPGRAFAPETPAELVDGDMVFFLVFGAAEFKRGGNGCTASTNDRHFNGFCVTHNLVPSLCYTA